MGKRRKKGVPLLAPDEKRRRLQAGGSRGGTIAARAKWTAWAEAEGLDLETWIARRDQAAEEKRRNQEQLRSDIERDKAICEALGITLGFYRCHRFDKTELGKLRAEGGPQAMWREAKRRRAAKAARERALRDAEAIGVGLHYFRKLP